MGPVSPRLARIAPETGFKDPFLEIKGDACAFVPDHDPIDCFWSRAYYPSCFNFDPAPFGAVANCVIQSDPQQVGIGLPPRPDPVGLALDHKH